MTFARRSLTGTRVYTQNLFQTLSKLSDWEFIEVSGGADTSARRFGAMRGNALSILWLLNQAEREAKRVQPDIYHAGAYLAPLRLPCPAVLNVFDTTYLAYPQYFDWKWNLYARTIIPRAAQNAAAILTLSEHSRDRDLQAYNVPRERVHIFAPGLGPEFQPSI
jgi:hypothetical protein